MHESCKLKIAVIKIHARSFAWLIIGLLCAG